MCARSPWASGWATGSRAESAGRNGIAHFIEHMVFKGTRKRTAEEIAQSVDSVGGMLDAFTAKEMTCFNAKVLDEHLPVAVDVLSDLVLRPRFDRRRHRQGKAGSPRRNQDGRGQPRIPDPRTVHAEFLARASAGHADPGHSGNRVAIFTGRGARSVSREWYAPNHIVITAAGNLEHARLVDLVAREFGRRGAFGRRGEASAARNACLRRAARQKGTRAGAHRARRAVLSAGARTALRGLAAERDPRRRHVLAPVSEYPRAAGPGLRDRERSLPVHRFGRAFRVCRNFARIRGAADSFGVRRIPRASAQTESAPRNCAAPKTT